jgi:hypothetical protein
MEVPRDMISLLAVQALMETSLLALIAKFELIESKELLTHTSYQIS